MNSPGGSESRGAHAPLRAEVLGRAWVAVRGAASCAGSGRGLVPHIDSRGVRDCGPRAFVVIDSLARCARWWHCRWITLCVCCLGVASPLPPWPAHTPAGDHGCVVIRWSIADCDLPSPSASWASHAKWSHSRNASSRAARDVRAGLILTIVVMRAHTGGGQSNHLLNCASAALPAACAQLWDHGWVIPVGAAEPCRPLPSFSRVHPRERTKSVCFTWNGQRRARALRSDRPHIRGIA